MKRILFIFFLIGIVFTLFFFFKRDTIKNTQTKPTISIKNHVFELELAKTESEKQQGLGLRSSLAKDSGMLFMYEAPTVLRFWMKGMQFPIDILYINDNKIVSLYKNLPPPANPNEQLPTYSSNEPANYVLEINGGLSDTYGFTIGDAVEIKNIHE